MIMSWETKEIKNKLQRINELSAAGLNIPRMIFLPQEAPGSEIDKVIQWALKICNQDKDQIFNIRTYKREGTIETLQTIHITDIRFENIKSELLKTNLEYNCMIDAETPDNGRVAGNIILDVNDAGNFFRYTIDYCKKPIRAMVRDHDNTMSGFIKDVPEYPYNGIVYNALKFNRVNTILEFTHFCKPAGVKQEKLVFWEYRTEK